MPKPLRIAMVNLFGNGAFSGGVPRAMLSRAQFLISQGHSVDIYFQALGEPLSAFEAGGVKVRPIPGDRLSRYLAAKNRFGWSARKLARAVFSSGRYDIIDLHDGGLYQGFTRQLQSKPTPTAFTVHSSAMLNPEPRPQFIVDYNRKNELLTAAGVDLILPVSKYVFEPFSNHGHEQKGRVVYNCVPEDALEAGTAGYQEPVPNEPLKLIFAARYAWNKGLDVAIEALKLLPEPGRFLITAFGEGPYEAEYRDTVKTLGLEASLQLSKNISDRREMIARYRNSHLFLLPTRFEAFSVALLEAYGIGLPSVTTTIPPNLELDPTSKLMSEPGNAAQLAAALQRIDAERDNLPSLSEEARRIASSFKAEIVYPKLIDAYREVSR